MAGRKVLVTRISPLAAFRTTLALSLVGLVAWVICASLLYLGLDIAGVWDHVNDIIGGIGGDQVVSFGLVLSLAGLLGAIVTIMLSVLAPLTAVIYNSLVDLFGGLELTVRDDK
ncbi:DUF3566 domain-containing protein [Corynebacterium sp. sy017]|uniref:DUF3566 domain-containing protein n=1 Tax=unclassified Corynebacterium TaxID=2624378 RepID=UPI001184B309|nr:MULTISPECIES: DUF3566 domain-containing protein [unclassified Corynebacterium]MBP3088277.1 DUF3566 domain-containing protein [Corynebacterium sp. sy017]QDZ41735.1 DUF3566 domain-containing protein [Corynebacterium sp. sy039]TSD91602.1 DUF3566 domain-containing protein [Corynebacterium sp. SY003]